MNARDTLKEELDRSFSTQYWKDLSANVRAYQPNVVVLVARKTPRLSELLELNFGESVVVISDLAIPFCPEIFQRQRVAIVDDVINVGSTIENAMNQAYSCGAISCRVFALAAKSHNDSMPLENVCLVNDEPMDNAKYMDFVRNIPSMLQLVSKPYDMDFPVIPCAVRPPFGQPHEVYAWLRRMFGKRVHVLTTEMEDRHNLARYTIDFPAPEGVNLKTRLYFDFQSMQCNVVPMAIPNVFSGKLEYSVGDWSRTIWEVLGDRLKSSPEEALLWGEEPLARVELFAHSLAFSNQVLSEIQPLLSQLSCIPFSIEDASLIFGPDAIATVVSQVTSSKIEAGKFDADALSNSSSATESSPFRSVLNASELDRVEASGELVLKRMDIVGAFHSLFENLAECVGANNYKHYSLSRPYSKSDILSKPYLRLRIGYTYRDLIEFFGSKISYLVDNAVSVRDLVSVLLDEYIDSGALVPTIAKLDGKCYRVYRKGEADFRDKETQRCMYAWSALEKPLSLTRFSKLTAILSFSNAVETSLVPMAYERGNVGYLPPLVVDRSGAEFSHYLARCGNLKVVENEQG